MSSKNRRRRNRRRQPKPHPNAWWAKDFLKPTEDDPEKRELREKLELANELVVEARLRVKRDRWR